MTSVDTREARRWPCTHCSYARRRDSKAANAVNHLSVVQLPVNVDLTLGDVASQIRDWMGDVCSESVDTVGQSVGQHDITDS